MNITELFTCVSCGFHPLVFEGTDEYESHPDTGDIYCWGCALQEFPEHICGDYSL